MLSRLLLRARLCLVLSLGVLAAACTGNFPPRGDAGEPTADAMAQARQEALARALPMPDDAAVQSVYLDWHDAERQRDVPAKLYLPANGAGPAPLVVFSHGLGGSREGYSYLGRYLAAHGYASLHLQHRGSDRALWYGERLALIGRLQDAASEAEVMHRVRDLRFALDRVLADPALAPRLDAQRIAAAGHSYGANTVLLAAGARVQRDGAPLADLREPRIRAAVLISAPPFHGERDPEAITRAVAVPTLHVTAVDDDIRVPGYFSGLAERRELFRQTGDAQAARKALAVFTGGSHSMFTDRLGTGGLEHNPRVKAATRELALAFFDAPLGGQTQALARWPERHRALLSDYQSTF